MVDKALFSSASCEWGTPARLFEKLNSIFNFNLDPCATLENAKCKMYFTKNDDGLSKKWFGRVFCNPPYGRDISKWVNKAHDEFYCGNCEAVVLLLPSRTDTRYFHDYILGKSEIIFLRGRLKFGNSKNSAPFPSLLAIYQKTLQQKIL